MTAHFPVVCLCDDTQPVSLQDTDETLAPPVGLLE